MYIHGIKKREVPTSLTPPIVSTAGLVVAVGKAPIHLAKNPAKVNRPTLCYTYEEAVEQFGYSDDWEKYSLCEVMYSHFVLYNMAPLVLVNVLDPETTSTEVENMPVTFKGDEALIDEPDMLTDTLVLLAGEEELERDVDYIGSRDDDGNIKITTLTPKAKKDVTASFGKVTPEAVTKEDIVGGIDMETLEPKGLETVDLVFPLTRLVPGVLIAPGYSHHPDVGAVMTAKMSNINSHFTGIALTDADPSIRRYTDIPKWKEDNSYTAKEQMVLWPKVQLGDRVFHMSTHIAGVINKTDAANGGIPYNSPSNKELQANGLVTEEGHEIVLAPDQASYLNGQGVMTGLNFIGGWRAWGNRTGAYPGQSDPKDTFLSVRRMFDWVGNTLILTFWQKIDDPTNRRFIDSIVDSANIWINSLTPEYLLGGRVEFRREDNPTTDLMDGKVKFRVFMTPPSPAREIEFIQEYDPSYMDGLF